MRGAVSFSFDSRPWFGEIGAHTLVVGETHEEAVPRHQFDTLVGGIPAGDRPAGRSCQSHPHLDPHERTRGYHRRPPTMTKPSTVRQHERP